MTQNNTFNPHEHMMQLKSREGSKDYLPVQWRLVWFRELCPNGTIDTEEMQVDLDREMTVEAFVWNQEKRKSEKVLKSAKGYARYRAIVTDGKGGRATGTGSECAADFNDYIEKAETKAIGRALAALGYGTQFAPDFNEEHRIVDSGVEPHQVRPMPQQQSQTAAPSQGNATAQQMTSIAKLSEHLGKAVPPPEQVATYEQAKDVIALLSQQYRNSRTKAS